MKQTGREMKDKMRGKRKDRDFAVAGTLPSAATPALFMLTHTNQVDPH
ncbi:hypothetical protein [Paenibacillus macerans]|nr:hypothetical protein [Paenibacillus macerans]MCM3699751.1 hypothetical protein [Paenibacillus macerans]